MEQRLIYIRTYVQRLATVLEPDEIVILDQGCVIFRIPEQKALEQIGELDSLVLPIEGPGEDCDEKLTYACQEILDLNTQRKPNSQILEAYYKLGALLAEKGWNDASRKKFNIGEGYLYVVKHINITILEKIYDKDFLNKLLVEAWAQRQGELYCSLDSTELILLNKG
ncbi:hypothetical protein C2G38_2217234 [Gigaspora rosea]|uniref:Uncharacterized protein n=1 Tax=Gigaspora rosea TaxID=44941 RepID=A0A397U8A2_9GLOM|nr:hypothetical protein C2G38_2217234 [Gigaspora rosea]